MKRELSRRSVTSVALRSAMFKSVVVAMGLLLATQLQAAPDSKPAAVPNAANAASSASAAPSTATPVLPSASQPSTSPAVQAAENAQEPGKLAPEAKVVPQIVLPLRSAGSLDDGAVPGALNASTGTASGNGQIDQSAARCAAQKTKAARDACKAAAK